MIPGLTIASTNPTATSVAATLAAVANPSGSFSVVQMASGTIGDTPGSLPGTLDLTFKNPITKDNTLLMFVAPAFGWTVTPSSGIDVWVPTPTGGTWEDLTGHENGATTIDQIFYTLHSAGGETTVSVTIAGEGPSVPIVDVFVFEIASLISFDVVYPLPTDAATWQGSSGQNVNGVLPITTTTAPDVIISWWYSSSIPGTESTLIYASSLDPDANTWFGPWMFEYQIANDQGVPGAYTSTAEDVTSGDFGQALASIAFKIAYAPPEPNPLACGNSPFWNLPNTGNSCAIAPTSTATRYTSLSTISNPDNPAIQISFPSPSTYIPSNLPPLSTPSIVIDPSSDPIIMPDTDPLPLPPALDPAQESTFSGQLAWILGADIPSNSSPSQLATWLEDQAIALPADIENGVLGGLDTVYQFAFNFITASPLSSLSPTNLQITLSLGMAFPSLVRPLGSIFLTNQYLANAPIEYYPYFSPSANSSLYDLATQGIYSLLINGGGKNLPTILVNGLEVPAINGVPAVQAVQDAVGSLISALLAYEEATAVTIRGIPPAPDTLTPAQVVNTALSVQVRNMLASYFYSMNWIAPTSWSNYLKPPGTPLLNADPVDVVSTIKQMTAVITDLKEAVDDPEKIQMLQQEVEAIIKSCP